MKKEEMENLTTSIQEKLGKEASAKIADDLGKLITDNAQMNKEIENRNSQITKLKQDKEMLIQANGNLLLKVPQGKEEKEVEEKEKDPRDFDFRTVFENGKFKISIFSFHFVDRSIVEDSLRLNVWIELEIYPRTM